MLNPARALVATLAAGAILLAGCTASLGPQQTETVRRDFEVGAAPALLIESDAGAIDVTAAGDGKLSVSAEKRANSRSGLDQMQVDFSQNGDTVRVVFKRPRALDLDNTHVAFTIQAPAATKLALSTAGGSIGVKGFAGGATARTSGGSLRALDVKGPVTLKTSGGSIEVARAEGEIEVETSGGAIRSTDVKGSQTLKTSGGSITVRGADGAVQADTSGGSVTLEGRLSGASRGHTSGGSVTVRLPADANLKVTAKGGKVSSDFGLASPSPSRLEGAIGAGSGGTLDLSTSGGGVEIRRS